jgi:AcrR family transcriptional regulator
MIVMPRTKEQNEAMREATRVKIHSAAVKLFSVKGFAATGVQEIADAARISIGLLYRHYKTKDDIFGALVLEALEGLEQVGQLFESDMSPAHAIRIFTDEIINDFTVNDEFMQYMTLLSQPFLTNQNYPWMNDMLERNVLVRNQLARLIEKGQALGQFKNGDPDCMSQYYFSIIQGICFMKQSLKESYIIPGAEMITAYLIKEEQNES